MKKVKKERIWAWSDCCCTSFPLSLSSRSLSCLYSFCSKRWNTWKHNLNIAPITHWEGTFQRDHHSDRVWVPTSRALAEIELLDPQTTVTTDLSYLQNWNILLVNMQMLHLGHKLQTSQQPLQHPTPASPAPLCTGLTVMEGWSVQVLNTKHIVRLIVWLCSKY